MEMILNYTLLSFGKSVLLNIRRIVTPMVMDESATLNMALKKVK